MLLVPPTTASPPSKGTEQSELILEIRYEPNPKVLDHRGEWAERISLQMSLPHWLIVDNRLDVFGTDQQTRCFVGFRNAGFVTRNPPTSNYFPDQALKFCKLLFEFEGFQRPLNVERIGVRSRFLTPFRGDMDELMGRYMKRYFHLTAPGATAMGGKVIDVGGALNFVDRFGQFNTNGGPMPRSQAEGFFPGRTDLPECGLYLDIDYFVKPQAAMRYEDVSKKVKDFATETLRKHSQFVQLMTCEDFDGGEGAYPKYAQPEDARPSA